MAPRPATKMSTHLPLLAGFAPDAIVGWRSGRPVDARRFVATAQALAQAMPPQAYGLNLCEDRLNFAVGFAAALLRGSVTLLPPTRARGALSDLQRLYGPLFAFVDRPGAFDDVAHIDLRAWPDPITSARAPTIDPDCTAVALFTSGSTGAPRAHAKRWGSLVAGAGALRERLQLAPGAALLGTVPPQHMWGLEATVMLPLQSGCAIASATPLLPAEVAAQLAGVDSPRWLVTVPLHLDALVATRTAMPALAGVLSATSPLDPSLARAFENVAHSPLVEIYGSTETGAVATRRPAQDATFALLDGLRLEVEAGRATVSGGHVGNPVTLQDRVDDATPAGFRLGARVKDLVKVGGKRASLATLNYELARVPGVVDGVFWLPRSGRSTQRLAAFVVAPGATRAAILAGLRERIDPAFLPRPMILVDALPRDALGKLPRAELEALAARALDANTA